MDDTKLLSLATTIQQREAPNYTEGQYHRSQEQGPGQFTTRYGVDLTKFPKNEGENDFDHFKRTYSTFATSHTQASQKLPKANSADLFKIIWNAGATSKPAKALAEADVATPVGKNKLFASINSWVGVNVGGADYWSYGLTVARAKDWNIVAKAYSPDMVITDVKFWEDKAAKRTYRQYLNSEGKVLRTMYATKPLAPKSSNIIGKTIKIGDK